MSETAGTEGQPTTPTHNGQPSTETNPEPAQAFTQADVDKIVKERVARERAKFADYDDLKSKAAGAKTLEDRIAEMEKRASDAETRALRNDVATKHGISAEDRDLFLTGVDEDTLTAQAKRLAERESERKKRNNTVPREGNNPSGGTSNLREFTRGLFGDGA